MSKNCETAGAIKHTYHLLSPGQKMAMRKPTAAMPSGSSGPESVTSFTGSGSAGAASCMGASAAASAVGSGSATGDGRGGGTSLTCSSRRICSLPTCAAFGTCTSALPACSSLAATRLDPLLRAVFIGHAVRVVRRVVRVNGAGVREVVLRPATEATRGASADRSAARHVSERHKQLRCSRKSSCETIATLGSSTGSAGVYTCGTSSDAPQHSHLAADQPVGVHSSRVPAARGAARGACTRQKRARIESRCLAKSLLRGLQQRSPGTHRRYMRREVFSSRNTRCAASSLSPHSLAAAGLVLAAPLPLPLAPAGAASPAGASTAIAAALASAPAAALAGGGSFDGVSSAPGGVVTSGAAGKPSHGGLPSSRARLGRPPAASMAPGGEGARLNAPAWQTSPNRAIGGKGRWRPLRGGPAPDRPAVRAPWTPWHGCLRSRPWGVLLRSLQRLRCT